MQRFTAYRRNASQLETHNDKQKNPDHVPQFEGIIWTDGTVTLRWLTACRSTSVWNSLQDMLDIHGHPEYGTEIVWHDGVVPQEWIDQNHKAGIYPSFINIGTPIEALQFATDLLNYDQCQDFLVDWAEGDISDWPKYKEYLNAKDES